MPTFRDLKGQKFGRLTVLEFAERRNGHTYWLCRCSCGKEITVAGISLTKKKHSTVSCGCYNREKTIQLNKERAMHHCDGFNSRLYRIWSGMKTRCNNKSHKDYKRYGARGISVCDKWTNNFNAFKEWALSNGYKENLTLDRLNNDGNYEPSNCRWATYKEQANNRRKGVIL